MDNKQVLFDRINTETVYSFIPIENQKEKSNFYIVQIKKEIGDYVNKITKLKVILKSKKYNKNVLFYFYIYPDLDVSSKVFMDISSVREALFKEIGKEKFNTLLKSAEPKPKK